MPKLKSTLRFILYLGLSFKGISACSSEEHFFYGVTAKKASSDSKLYKALAASCDNLEKYAKLWYRQVKNYSTQNNSDRTKIDAEFLEYYTLTIADDKKECGLTEMSDS